MALVNPLNESAVLPPEEAVRKGYSAGALAAEAALCCPVLYDSRFLDAIPAEVLERDYGCGDPTPYVWPGDIVLDLGAGGGKVCFIAAQIVGPQGRVIGADCNREMLARAVQGDVRADRATGVCPGRSRRHPRESKGADYTATTDASDTCCGPGGACC
jgi:SAM-dependent methyltransferase